MSFFWDAEPCKPDAATAKVLQENFVEQCDHAAEVLDEADVLVLITGAGFSADSGLAVYADVANVPAYSMRSLDYFCICQPDWLEDEPELFYGFWGQCFNDYRGTQPHEGYDIIARWRNDKNHHDPPPHHNKGVAQELQARVHKKVDFAKLRFLATALLELLGYEKDKIVCVSLFPDKNQEYGQRAAANRFVSLSCVDCTGTMQYAENSNMDTEKQQTDSSSDPTKFF